MAEKKKNSQQKKKKKQEFGGVHPQNEHPQHGFLCFMDPMTQDTATRDPDLLRLSPPLKTNMAGWKIPHLWRCISYWKWWFSNYNSHVSFQGCEFQKWDCGKKSRKTWGKKTKYPWYNLERGSTCRPHLGKKIKHPCLKSPTPPNTNLFPLPSPEKKTLGVLFSWKKITLCEEII